jgi:hypothetical protein
MKRTGISFLFAGLSAVLLSAGAARADRTRLQYDPSGAPQCFTETVQKAPLARCFVALEDPSSAPQCFSQTGEKAPLVYCRAVAPFGYVVQHDPSGAAMCMTTTGNKAPLARCASLLASENAVVASR